MSTEMLQKNYKLSNNVIARKYDDEILILPINSNVADLQESLFSLNGTGISIWEKINPEKSVEVILGELSEEYNAPAENIRDDVFGFIAELEKRKLIETVA